FGLLSEQPVASRATDRSRIAVRFTGLPSQVGGSGTPQCAPRPPATHAYIYSKGSRSRCVNAMIAWGALMTTYDVTKHVIHTRADGVLDGTTPDQVAALARAAASADRVVI